MQPEAPPEPRRVVLRVVLELLGEVVVVRVAEAQVGWLLEGGYGRSLHREWFLETRMGCCQPVVASEKVQAYEGVTCGCLMGGWYLAVL